MKKTTKMIILSLSFCFIVAFGVFCVFAAKNFTLTSSGEVEFIAPGVEASISAASLSGIERIEGSGAMQGFSLSRDMDENQATSLEGFKSWQNIKLFFDSENEDSAKLTFTVTNNSSKTTENILVEIRTNTPVTSLVQAIPTANFCVTPGTNHTFTINFAVGDVINSAKVNDFKIIVEMTIIKPSEVLSVTEQQSKGLAFTTNSSTKTASFTKYTGTETSVTIPSVIKDASNNLYTVTEIANATSSTSPFASVKSTLTSISIPRTITQIGSYAFNECSALGGVSIPDSVLTIGDFAFNECSAMSGDLIIPSSVTSIGASAFYHCQGFEGVLIIGKRVKTIGNYAFYQCLGLTGGLEIPHSVTSIGVQAFKHCWALDGDLKIGKRVTTIATEAFSNCFNFSGQLIISGNVETIGHGAFAKCSKFDTITVENNSGNYYSRNNCLISKQDKVLVLGCVNSVIPQDEDILKIGDYAFFEVALTGVITIPSTVTEIGTEAFYSCKNISGILTIPDSVTTIGERAFYNCSGLNSSLMIGASVTTIGESAFENCSKLYSITIKATVPPTLGGVNCFANTGTGYIYVPSANLEEYKVATNWDQYATRLYASTT